MKPQDLRIGNIVMGTPFSHPRLGMHIDGTTMVMAGGILAFEQRKSTYAPIPLTEEWMKKFGLHREEQEEDEIDDEDVEWKWWVGGFYLHQPKHSKEFLYATYVRGDGSFKGGVQIKFVHELQNLAYALTKKELEMRS